jgi:hypothetical protein
MKKPLRSFTSGSDLKITETVKMVTDVIGKLKS